MKKCKTKYSNDEIHKIVEQNDCILLGDYNGVCEKYEFICKCGNHFITTMHKFLNRNKRQCNSCGRKSASQKQMLHYDDVKEKIEKYNCTLISNTYTNYKTKDLKIKCHCGNIFVTSLANFENSKHQCIKCSRKDANEFKNKYDKEYINQLCKKNGSSIVEIPKGNYINTKSNITLKCKECGCDFTTSLGYILSVNKFTCNNCSYQNAPSSSGEITIHNILKKYNINFKEQYSFDDCIDKQRLRFDFIIFTENNKLAIEFDGIQHFYPFDYYGGIEKYNDVIRKDTIKNNYCKENKIPLLRIKYNNLNIEDAVFHFLYENMTIPCQAIIEK